MRVEERKVFERVHQSLSPVSPSSVPSLQAQPVDVLSKLADVLEEVWTRTNAHAHTRARSNTQTHACTVKRTNIHMHKGTHMHTNI